MREVVVKNLLLRARPAGAIPPGHSQFVGQVGETVISHQERVFFFRDLISKPFTGPFHIRGRVFEIIEVVPQKHGRQIRMQGSDGSDKFYFVVNVGDDQTRIFAIYVRQRGVLSDGENLNTQVFAKLVIPKNPPSPDLQNEDG